MSNDDEFEFSALISRWLFSDTPTKRAENKPEIVNMTVSIYSMSKCSNFWENVSITQKFCFVFQNASENELDEMAAWLKNAVIRIRCVHELQIEKRHLQIFHSISGYERTGRQSDQHGIRPIFGRTGRGRRKFTKCWHNCGHHKHIAAQEIR